MRPYYEILEVDESASQAEIKKAYRRLSKKWHPDKHQDPIKKMEVEAMQMAISEAYSVLGKPEKRVIYDELGINCPLDRIDKMANEAVLEIFRQLMKGRFEIDKLFTMAQQVAQNGIQRISQARNQISDRIDFLRSVIEKKVHGEMEHLQRAVREEIQNLEEQILKADMDAAVQKKTMEILKEDYTKEECEQFFAGGSITITTSATGGW